MRKIYMSLILLTFFGLSNVVGQQKMFYLKGSAAPYSIYYANLDGTSETLISSSVAVDNSASYRNGKICYNTGSQIRIVKTDGTGDIAVPNTTDAATNTEICFSPDGSKIVYSGATNNFKLFIINQDGSGKITFNDGSGVSQHQLYPSWNETGKIYFGISNSGDPYSQRIYSKPSIDTIATPTQLTTTFAQYPKSGGPSNKIVFNDQPGDLYLMNSDGTNQIALAAGTSSYATATWKLADSTIFYINGGNIWKIKMNNTGKTQITSSGNIANVFGIDYLNISDSIYIPDTVSHVSNTIEIPIRNTKSLTSSNNIISYQCNVTYNTTKLQYLSFNLTGTIAIGGNVVVNSSIPGKLVISYITSIPLTGTGNLLKLKFQPLQFGTSQLAISNFLYNTDTMTNTHNGNYTAIGMYGDIDTNGYVQAYDAALALQYSVGLNPLPTSAPRPWTDWRFVIANVDGSDTISANDASLILQYSAGVISSFPVGLKSLENPIADITITQGVNELIFTSTGELYGLNIFTTNGSNVTLQTPTSIDANMLSAFNIAGSTYNVGLCTAYSPADNTTIMKIPFTCTVSDTLTYNMFINKNTVVKKIFVDKSLGINENNKQVVNFYPNPTKDNLTIETNLNTEQRLEIINLIGQTVYTTYIDRKATINTSAYANGVYVLKLNSDKETIVRKFVKE